MQDYGGTKTEKEIMALVERGGVVGGSSAGASILGDFMVRGAPSNDNLIMDYPGYERAFGYLQERRHRPARRRALATARPRRLDHAEDTRTCSGSPRTKGTAWVVKGDTATIIGRNKAFVYNGKDATDPGLPFLTLHPGDKFNLNTRRVISRAITRSPVTEEFIKSMFAKYNDPAAGGATVLVAQNGEVFIDHAVRCRAAAAIHADDDGAAVQPRRHDRRVLRTVRFDAGAARPRPGAGARFKRCRCRYRRRGSRAWARRAAPVPAPAVRHANLRRHWGAPDVRAGFDPFFGGGEAAIVRSGRLKRKLQCIQLPYL